MRQETCRGRHTGAAVWLASALLLSMAAPSAADPIAERFEFLSANGNSNCSRTFLEGIAKMPADARLQGSCCSPMSPHRYREQVEALVKYAHIPEIPPDPYDVEAGLAQTLLAAYGTALDAGGQASYDAAMAASGEGGPCCCRCWRWSVFGGLGKRLILAYGFTAPQVAEVWDFVNGCGGDEDHVHD